MYEVEGDFVLEYCGVLIRVLKMKRPKFEPPNMRRFKLSHCLIGIGVIYLIFITFKFPQFLKIVSQLSGDERYSTLDEESLGGSSDADLSKPLFSSVYKDAFHRSLEDQDAPTRPNKEPLKEEHAPESVRQVRPRYGRITGDIFRRRNRTSNMTVFEKMADEAWTLGVKAWRELDKVDEKESLESSIVEGKPESCPSWISMSGEELVKGDRLMFLPCGLAAGSSITVVGTPHYSHKEYVPQLARMRGGSGLVSVSQFMVELQGLKSVDGEDPPKILHLNPRLRGDWSKQPVIEHNTCYRMQWGKAQRCDGLSSNDDEEMLGMIYHISS